MVIASFQQTLWTVNPMSSGAYRLKSVGKSSLREKLLVLVSDFSRGDNRFEMHLLVSIK